MKISKLKHPSISVQLLMTLGLAVLSGFTIMVMWNWYIAPFGLPVIGLIHALGIDMLVTFIITTKADDTTPFWDRWIFGTSYALITLFLGWLLHFAI